jgi:uncharacterized protein YbcI
MDEAPDRGRQAAAISNAITGLHREYYGRGGSRTRTVMGSDYVITFMSDVYAPVERTLIDADRFDVVQQTRRAFQEVMRERFTAAVEEITGRRVVGFMSQVHADPDLSVETFIMEHDSHDGPSATG